MSSKKAPAHIKSGPVPVIRPNWRKLPVDKLTRGERNCRFIEKMCRIPEGEKVGQPVVLIDAQIEFYLSIYDNPAGTDTAIKSMARKNSKTGDAAFIVVLHLVGPEAVQNSRIVSGAMSREQAGEVYNYASKCILLSPKLNPLCKINPSGKRIYGIPMGVEYQAISADSHTAHGKSPIVAILDEVGQIKGPRSDFVDAITTAQGAYMNPLLIYISTQAPTDADFFSVQIDDATLNKPAKTVCHVYAADPECDIMDEKAWKAANPALGIFRSAADVKKQAEKAERMPSFENTFRNLVLNQRVAVTAPFVSKTVWEANGAPSQIKPGDKFYGGLDLSAVNDLTALIGVNETGDVHCDFWLPEAGLLDKAKADRVPYDVWQKKGFLELTPGPAIEYEYIACRLKKTFEVYDVRQINFDRYNMKFLKPWLVKAGLTEEQIEKFKDFGQGFGSMSPALREFESMLLQKKLRHGMHPVLNMCAGNAIVETDAAGGRKFTKAKSNGRIDGMVGCAMAVDALVNREKVPEKKYQVFFV